MKKVTIHTDVHKLNIALIHDFISHSYWGKGRTIEQTRKSIANSLNFGIYLDDEQIGYARVVTDFTIFAYLLDVFIIEQERGKGYSKNLMDYIMMYPKLQDVKSWKLATADAHGLYEKYGFVRVEDPGKIMERNEKDIYSNSV